MRIIRTYKCQICDEIIEGTGDHMIKKFASISAGIDLNAKIERHNIKPNHRLTKVRIEKESENDRKVYDDNISNYINE